MVHPAICMKFSTLLTKKAERIDTSMPFFRLFSWILLIAGDVLVGITGASHSFKGVVLLLLTPLVLAFMNYTSGGPGTGTSQLLSLIPIALLFFIPLGTSCLFICFIVIGIIAVPSMIAGV